MRSKLHAGGKPHTKLINRSTFIRNVYKRLISHWPALDFAASSEARLAEQRRLLSWKRRLPSQKDSTKRRLRATEVVTVEASDSTGAGPTLPRTRSFTTCSLCFFWALGLLSSFSDFELGAISHWTAEVGTLAIGPRGGASGQRAIALPGCDSSRTKTKRIKTEKRRVGRSRLRTRRVKTRLSFPARFEKGRV